MSIAQQYSIMRRHGAPIGSKTAAQAKPAAAVPVPANGGQRSSEEGRQAQEGLDARPERRGAHAGRDRGGAQAFCRPLRVRGGRGVDRVPDPDLAARDRLRWPLQCRQVEPGERPDRSPLARPHLVEPRPHASDQLLRPRQQAPARRPAGLRLRPGLAIDEGDLAGSRLGLSARPAHPQARLPADRLAARREGPPIARP